MPQVFCFDGFEFDCQTGELRHGDVTHRLAEQPCQFLVALLERPGQVVTREELRSRLWSADTFIEFDTGLNSIARKLREALNDSVANPRFIETFPRRGYRFIARIEQQHAGANPSAVIPRKRTTWPLFVGATMVLIIVSTLALRRTEKTRYVDSEAHTFFLKGLSAASRETFDGLRDAVVHLEKATAHQPDFAAAHARLAVTHMQFAFVGPLGPATFLPNAEAAARKAVQLDDALPEAHGALGLVLRSQWNWQGALREFQRAIDLNADYAEGHRMHAGMLSLLGRKAEALTAMARARELDPLSLQTILDQASVLMGAGDRDRGLAELRNALSKFPARPRVHFRVGSVHLSQGDVDEALAELKEAVRLSSGNARFVAHLAYAEAIAGHHEEARRMLGDLLVRAQTEYVSPVGIALIRSTLGDPDSALEWVEVAYRKRAPDISRLFSEHEFQPLYADERVRDILARVGLPR